VSVVLCEPSGKFQVGSKTGKKYLPYSDTIGEINFQAFLFNLALQQIRLFMI